MENLRVLLIQFDIVWENPEANFQYIEKKIKSFEGKADLVILPEMFSTGFTMNPGRLTSLQLNQGPEWMKTCSKEYGVAICGSLIWKADNRFYNRFFFTSPDNRAEIYDKHHLFSLSDEPVVFFPGSEQIQFNYLGWNFRPVICYDLRFPIWCRNSLKNPYDVLIVPANWPRVRSQVWKTLLQARAIENQAYVIGVNRNGTDANGIYHSGDSAVADAGGNFISILSDTDGEVLVELSKKDLGDFRVKFPFLRDADSFELNHK